MPPHGTPPAAISEQERRAWYQHPVVALFLAPFILPVVTGVGSVWMTQSRQSDRLGVVEARQSETMHAIDEDKAEREQRLDELKRQIVPRSEHEGRWESVDQRLNAIQEQTKRTDERVDKIYELLMRKGNDAR